MHLPLRILLSSCRFLQFFFLGPAPAILPRAQTACSATTGWGEPNKEMKSATASALVRYSWCNVGECPGRFKLKIGARKIQTLLASEHQGNNHMLNLLADTTEELHKLGYNICIDEDVNGWITFSAQDFTCSMGSCDFLVFITTVDTWQLQTKINENDKQPFKWCTKLTINNIFNGHVSCSHTILLLKRAERFIIHFKVTSL